MPARITIASSLRRNPIEETVQAIRAATESIDVVVYKFDIVEVFDALNEAIKRRVQLRVLMDQKQLRKKNSLGSKLVGREGAEVRAWPGRKLHAKFAVVDATRVLCGSYNWTKSAAGKNLELLLTFEEPADVGSFKGLFGQLWEAAPQV